METPEVTTNDELLKLSQRIDQRIRPWKWSLALGVAFSALGLFAVIGDVEKFGSLQDVLAGYVTYCFLFGALFGMLAAHAARNIVKAIRC